MDQVEPMDFAKIGRDVTAGMERAAILDRVKKVLAEVSGKADDQMDETSHLSRDLCLDSLEKIETAMQLEDEFGIELEDREVDEACMGTIGGIVDRMMGKLNG